MKSSRIIFSTITSLLIGLSAFGQTANQDTIAVRTKSYALLLDGAVRNLESAGSKDLTSTGLVGFRFDDERTLFKMSISAFSTVDTIYNKETKPYSNSILNTGVTNTGFGSFSFEYMNRFIYLDGFRFYLAKKNYLASENPDDNLYNKWLQDNKISNLNWFKKHIGLRCYAEMNNTIWKNETNQVNNANVANLGIMLTYYKMFINNNSLNIDMIFGVGATSRIIFNDLGQDEPFRKAILGTSQKNFLGPELYAGIKINNAYAKISIPFLLSDKVIKGLTGGQPIVSLGIAADIGYKNTQKKLMRQVGTGIDSFKKQ